MVIKAFLIIAMAVFYFAIMSWDSRHIFRWKIPSRRYRMLGGAVGPALPDV